MGRQTPVQAFRAPARIGYSTSHRNNMGLGPFLGRVYCVASQSKGHSAILSRLKQLYLASCLVCVPCWHGVVMGSSFGPTRFVPYDRSCTQEGWPPQVEKAKGVFGMGGEGMSRYSRSFWSLVTVSSSSGRWRSALGSGGCTRWILLPSRPTCSGAAGKEDLRAGVVYAARVDLAL